MQTTLKVSAIVLIAVLILTQEVANATVVYCYWGTWAYYRTGNGKFEVSNIDPTLCTHLTYTFFGLNDDDTIRYMDSWLDNDLGTIDQAVALKQRNPNLKVFASVGGWNEGSSTYSAMAASPQRRQTFVNSAVNLLLRHGLDGFDLDWEYPVQRGGSPDDRVNFVRLLEELKNALKPHNRLLTIAVGATEASASQSYDIRGVAQHVDLINLMTYDLGGSWDGYLSFNAPLSGSGPNTVKASVNYWLQQGAPAEKLVVGIAMYGRSFTLSDNSQTRPGGPIRGGGTAGPYTREEGYLGYNEICETTGDWTKSWDDDGLVPYAYKDNQWVGYDNERSIVEKTNFIKSLNLAGAMVWSIETDDFRGVCGRNYPLLRTINENLGVVGGGNGGEIQPTSAPTQSTAQTSPPIAPTSGPTGDCSRDGYFINPNDCNRYYQCVGGYRYDFKCTDGLHFDVQNSVCNWPDQANCRI